jgi:hypothetical protein
MRRFLYEWIKYSVVFGAISSIYIIIFVFIIGIDLFQDDLKVYGERLQSAQTLSTVGFIFHEITSLFRFYFMDIFTLFFTRRCISTTSYPLRFIYDYLHYRDYYLIYLIISIVINSLVFGIIIYGVNQLSGVFEYARKYFINLLRKI